MSKRRREAFKKQKYKYIIEDSSINEEIDENIFHAFEDPEYDNISLYGILKWDKENKKWIQSKL